MTPSDALRDALAKYGFHQWGCKALADDKAVCTCGFDAAKALAASPGETPGLSDAKDAAHYGADKPAAPSAPKRWKCLHCGAVKAPVIPPIHYCHQTGHHERMEPVVAEGGAEG